MVQPILVPKKRGCPPLLSKPEVPEVQEIPKPPKAAESKPSVEGAIATIPKKRGCPPLHTRPEPPKSGGKVGESESERSKGTNSGKGTTSVGSAVEPKSKPTVVDSEKEEMGEKQEEEKKVPTENAVVKQAQTTVVETKNAVVDKKMETIDLNRKPTNGTPAAVAKPKVQLHSCKHPLEQPEDENVFKWRHTGDCHNRWCAPTWPPRSFPVLPVQTHTILLMALCAQCVHETSQRIQIFQPGGKEYIGVVMCQQCIKKNTVLLQTFK